MGQRTEQQLRNTVTGKVSNSSLFVTPLYAMRQTSDGNAESVRLLGMGDIEGHSPCYLFVGDTGISEWDSTGKFTIIDPTCLPASREALQSLGRTLTQGQDTNSTNR